MLIFTEGGKQENPEKNPRGKGENNASNKLNSHICPEQESNPDHSGKASTNALRHP
jgi:hypothetical protein